MTTRNPRLANSAASLKPAAAGQDEQRKPIERSGIRAPPNSGLNCSVPDRLCGTTLFRCSRPTSAPHLGQRGSPQLVSRFSSTLRSHSIGIRCRSRDRHHGRRIAPSHARKPSGKPLILPADSGKSGRLPRILNWMQRNVLQQGTSIGHSKWANVGTRPACMGMTRRLII